jgi:hypothetical protein
MARYETRSGALLPEAATPGGAGLGLEQKLIHVSRGRYPGPRIEAAQRGPKFDGPGAVTLRGGRHYAGDGDPMALSAPHQRRRRWHTGHLGALRTHDVNLSLAVGAPPGTHLARLRHFVRSLPPHCGRLPPQSQPGVERQSERTMIAAISARKRTDQHVDDEDRRGSHQ